MGNSEKKEKITYDVLLGENMEDDLLEQVMEIDTLVYEPIDKDFVGTKKNLESRFHQNRKTFVCLMKDDKLVGYINFFPMRDKLFDQILGPVIRPKLIGEGEGYDPEGSFEHYRKKDGSRDDEAIIAHYKDHQNPDPSVKIDIEYVADKYKECRDDDIGPSEIYPDYSEKKEENNLFIISVAIHPDYQGTGASRQLTDAFIDYLNVLEENHTPVNSISAICVSKEGEKFLRGLNFYFHRELGAKVEDWSDLSMRDYSEKLKGIDPVGFCAEKTEYHERVYLCWGYYLDRLKDRRMYHKTHKDDIYLFVPLAENPENTRIDDLISGFEQGEEDEEEGRFYHKGTIPGSKNDPKKEKKTQQLLDFLQYYVEYEYDGFIKTELERIYLGEFLFRHTTDRYIEDEFKNAVLENVGEEKADLLLLAYRSANTYVLVIYLPDCKYSSSMVGDQLSKMKLEMRTGIDEFGFHEYRSVTEFLKKEYNLVTCGAGKAFYCMNKKPGNDGYVSPEDEKNGKRPCKNQELMNILTGETYFSVHQDFYIKKYDKLREQLKEDLAIYDYYQAYMSAVSLVMILDTFDDEQSKVEDAATYVFIVELVLLQNTALTKLSKKVDKALEHEGNVPYEYISQLYKDYGRTLKLWDAANFKYYGTRMEAEQIRNALENDELRERYEKEQEFLENIVEVNAANDERRNGWILGIVGTLLAIFQVDGYIKYFIGEGIGKIAHLTGHAESIVGVFEDAGEEYLTALEGLSTHMFNVIVWGSIILFLLAYLVNKKRKKYEQRLVLRNEKDSENWED